MIIGITGGIGSGKSRVVQLWSFFFDLPLLDLDDICRQLLKKEHPGWLGLRKWFGNRFFDQDGNLDRAAFRQAIFTDNVLRNEVDSLLHPLAKSCMRDQCRQMSASIILVEIPLLFEAEWQQEIDRVVVVFADQATRCARIVARDGVSWKESAQAIGSQAPLGEKAMVADHVIENNGAWPDTSLQVLHLGRLYAGGV